MGTKPAVTRPIASIPPRSTEPTATASTMPTITGSQPKEARSWAATALDWVIEPMPKEARTAAQAKKTDSARPPAPPMARWR